jgi:hypothetical protein
LRNIPSNCSRYFEKKQDAENQPIAIINLDLDTSEMYVINTMYDESLIIQDLQYCTTNRFQLNNSVKNFEKVVMKQYLNKVVDIGCGQGEFVEHLRSTNIPAIGFDPVLRNENSYLAKRALKPLEENLGSNNIFTMRCVLPHLKNPFAFLEDIFFSDSQAIVYIEYQNLEWIIREQMWQQISHDHVNYFSIESFDCHFNVISRGVFGNGEWSFVLIDGKNTSNKTTLPSNLEKLIELEDSIPRILEEKIQRVRAPLGIYGAAGKGTLFAYELKKLGIVDVVAYDEESLFWNKFLEASGVQVQNPIEIAKLDSLTDLIVMNPNHYDHALSRYGAFTSIHK